MAHDAVRAGGIRAEDHDSYCIVRGRADAGLVLLCDHAGNAMPPEYGTLGLPPEQLARHIAYDIGAAQVTRALAAALGAPAVMTRYSRLLIDPNRGTDDPTLIMRLSDGAVIPGNRRLDDGRAREAHRASTTSPITAPSHAVIDRCIASGVTPSIVVDPFLHRELEGAPAAVACRRALGPGPAPGRAAARGASTPRAISSSATTSPTRASSRATACGSTRTCAGLANALIEMRQDLIRDAAGQAAWAGRLCRIVERILGATLDRRPPATASAGRSGLAQRRSARSTTELET